MDTSRIDGVKAPQHRGTPRSRREALLVVEGRRVVQASRDGAAAPRGGGAHMEESGVIHMGTGQAGLGLRRPDECGARRFIVPRQGRYSTLRAPPGPFLEAGVAQGRRHDEQRRVRRTQIIICIRLRNTPARICRNALSCKFCAQVDVGTYCRRRARFSGFDEALQSIPSQRAVIQII